MFKNTYQSGFLSILFAGGSKPLSIWGEEVRNGHIRRVTDEDVQTLALELMGTNVATTFIICPSGKKDTLGIRLPFFIMIVKNMKKYFTFEITVLGSSYIETLRVQIHANVRIRRIYFSDRLYAEDEMPQEFKLYVPISSKKDKEAKTPVEDKSTGADKVRASAAAEAKPETAKEEEPSGAPPTPTETAREEPAEAAATEESPAPEAEAAPSEAEEAPSEAGEPAEESEAASEAPGEEGEAAAGEETAAEEGAEPTEAAGEETPAETAGEETPAEETAVEESAAEEAPAEEAPAEEAPAEEAPAEEAPAEAAAE